MKMNTETGVQRVEILGQPHEPMLHYLSTHAVLRAPRISEELKKLFSQTK
jgi:hypothetical protein